MDTLSYLRQFAEQVGSDFPFGNLQNTTKQMTERYLLQSGRGIPLTTSAEEIACYAAVRMPATFSAVRAALTETLLCTPKMPRTLLDAGAGMGAATLAAAEQIKLDAVVMIEREHQMIEYGKKLTNLMGINHIALWQKQDYILEGLNCTADLVIASYTLNELTEKAREKAVKSLFDATDEILLLVEPGTPEAFRQLKAARATLQAMGGKVIAPCAANNCGIVGDDWCHFTVRVPRGKLHKRLKGGDAPYEDEKFCYLAVSKTDGIPSQARVLRHPNIQKGKIELVLCGKKGIRRVRVAKGDAENFRFARKCSAGDGCNLKIYESGAKKDESHHAQLTNITETID